MVSFRGQKKLGPRRSDRSPLGGLIQSFRRASPPLSYADPPSPEPPTYASDVLTRLRRSTNI